MSGYFFFFLNNNTFGERQHPLSKQIHIVKEVLRQVTMEMSYLTHITQKQTADNQYTCFVFVCACVTALGK